MRQLQFCSYNTKLLAFRLTIDAPNVYSVYHMYFVYEVDTLGKNLRPVAPFTNMD